VCLCVCARAHVLVCVCVCAFVHEPTKNEISIIASVPLQR
jgi:hypothetical protein